VVCRSKHIRKLEVILILLSLGVLPNSVYTQVVEFSNFNQEGFYLLPQNAGKHDYKYILSNNINIKKILSNQSFNSVLVSEDYKIRTGQNKLVLGGAYYYSKLLGNPLSDQALYLTIAHHRIFRNNEIHFGFQPGILLRQFDRNSLTFPDQYDRNTGSFNPDISTDEIDFPDSKIFGYSVNIGIGWTHYYQNLKIAFDFAWRNLNQPSLAFSGHPVYLYRNNIVSISSSYNLTGLNQIQIYTLNNNSMLLNELFIGAKFYHKFGNDEYLVDAVTVGNQWAIRNKNYPNDFILNAGINLKKTTVGFAYSFNVNGKNKKIATYNTYEISLIFKGIYEYYRQFTPPCRVR
jgi:hypothetical protein